MIMKIFTEKVDVKAEPKVDTKNSTYKKKDNNIQVFF